MIIKNPLIIKKANLQSKTATPTTQNQTITFDSGYDGLSEVQVKAVTSAIDSNITPTNIRAGVTVLGVQGNLEPDKPDQSKTANPSTSIQTITADAGYELASVTINPVTSDIDSNITADNIKKDVTILGVTGTLESGDGTSKLPQVVDGSAIEITADDLAGATKIRNHAFYHDENLQSIQIPDSVTSIGEYAFYKNTALSHITIPGNVTSIGDYGFALCSALTPIIIENGITTLGNYIFRDCSALSSIEIPDSVTSIGIDAFWNCTNLESVVLSNSLTELSPSLFLTCTKLASVEIPNSVTKIGNAVFYQCYALTDITIPERVTDIGVKVFYQCSRLTTITIKATTPPTLASTDAISSATTTIYIPKGTLSAYQSATNWSSFASKFVELS